MKPIDTKPLHKLQRSAPARDLDDETQDEFSHLPRTLKYVQRTRKRVFETDGFIARVCRDLERLPAADETYHMVLDGRYPLWSFIPGILKLSSTPIVSLQVATLGFSRDNIAQLCEMLDAGQVSDVAILASHYFKHASADIFDPAAAVLGARGQRLHAIRNHCKIINLELADGRTYTVESSANMRSCKNIEQAVVCHDRGLYQLHRGWILDRFEEDGGTK